MGQQKQSFWNSIKQKASEVGKAATEKTTQAAKKTVDQMGNAVSQQASKAGKAVQEKATEVKDSITHQATVAGHNMINTATESVDSVAKSSKKWVNQIHFDQEDSRESATAPDWSLDELYHIFLGHQITHVGGYQTVTLKTGKSYDVNIPPNRTKGSNLRLKGCGIQGNDVFLVLHTLVNPFFNVDRKINQLIAQAPIYDRSKIRCLEAYNQINAAQGIDDLPALNLLDYLVSTSKLDAEIAQHYTIGSQNSRLVRLKRCLDTALSASNLSKTEQQLIKATYQYIIAAEAVPNLQTLTSLDAIILNSSLDQGLKKYYLHRSVTSRVMTLDLIMINVLNSSPAIQQDNPDRWLSVYSTFRADQDVIDGITLDALDQWFPQAPLPDSCKTIYQLMRHHRLELNEEFEQDDYRETFELIQSVLKSFKTNKESSSVPENQLINVAQIPPRTLAEKTYYSVSRGGLGWLGGLKIITGVNLFLEVAARVAIAQVCLIDQSEKINLGINAVTHSSHSSVAGSNWQAVGSFGMLRTDISQLSGVAAYQAILEEIGGITALIDDHTILSKKSQEGRILNLLKGKHNQQRILKELETQMYS